MQDSGKLRTSATGRGHTGLTTGACSTTVAKATVLGLVAEWGPETVSCLVPNKYCVIERCRMPSRCTRIKFICRGERQA